MAWNIHDWEWFVYTTYKNGADWGMVCDIVLHIYICKYLYMICQLFVYMFMICIMYLAPEEYSASMVLVRYAVHWSMFHKQVENTVVAVPYKDIDIIIYWHISFHIIHPVFHRITSFINTYTIKPHWSPWDTPCGKKQVIWTIPLQVFSSWMVNTALFYPH